MMLNSPSAAEYAIRPARQWQLAPTHVLLPYLALISVFFIACGALYTNDGPLHAVYSAFLTNAGGGPLQSAFYEAPSLKATNTLAYLLIGMLARVIGITNAETLVQYAACVMAPSAVTLGCWLINRRHVWVAALSFPLVLNKPLFLGLYNSTLSIALAMACMVILLLQQRNRGRNHAGWLALGLALALFMHPSGVIVAVTTGLTFVAGAIIADEDRAQAVMRWRWHVLAFVCAGALLAAFSLAGGGGPAEYGLDLKVRLIRLLTLSTLAINGVPRLLTSVYAATVLLFIGFAVATHLSGRREASRFLLPVALATVVALGLMLAFPDVAGGGWTHVMRFETVPWLFAVLLMAALPLPQREAVLLVPAATALICFQLVSASDVQAEVRREMTPFLQVDQRVGAHCSILPLVLDPGLVDSRYSGDSIGAKPFIHAANRMELRGDRVVLYNLLSRLGMYPVTFRSGREPQSGLFGWEPGRRLASINAVDVNGFEARTHATVDYVLVRSDGRSDVDSLATRLLGAARANYAPVFRSADSAVGLYRRLTVGPLCGASRG